MKGMFQWRASGPALPLLAALLASFSGAAEITVSLVDSERGAPLEYWVKEAKLADGGTLAYCAPFVFIDGVQRPYPEIGGGMAIEGGDDEIANSIVDVIADEGSSDESAIVSDNRPPNLRNQGWTAKIKLDGLAAGRHVLLPGGAAFTIGPDGLLEGADAPLEAASSQFLKVKCVPVDTEQD